MTVSNAMTEAGIATYERINRARMSPQAIVAAIYNAMDTVRRRESVKPPAMVAAYVHQSWPAFRYGPNGQSAKFASESDVPPGWVDSPKKLDAPTFVEAAQALGAETMADLAEKRRPGRPRKEAA